MGDKKVVRVLVGKPGLDGHDRAAKVMARALRDAGFEVIYTGIRQTPAQVAQTAVQEDVDVVVLNNLTGAHLEVFPLVVEELKKRGRDDIYVLATGVIPFEDVGPLKEKGIDEVFGPGTGPIHIINWIKEHVMGESEGA